MSVINDLIRTEENGTLSFGNTELPAKAKLDGYEYNGDLYKIKTFKEITKLEKNGTMVYESGPGTVVHDLKIEENTVTFQVEGTEDAQITLEMEAGKEYKIYVDDTNLGKMKTNLGGKLSFSVELVPNEIATVKIHKVYKEQTEWQKQNRCFFARNAGMNQANGWGNVPAVRLGIHL